MTDSPKATAITNKQIVERLATEVMGWKLYNYDSDEYATTTEHYDDAMSNDGWHWEGDPDTSREAWQFHPESNWNDWRQVEENMLSNLDLQKAYYTKMQESYHGQWMMMEEIMTEADIPTRCKALLDALDSLPNTNHD